MEWVQHIAQHYLKPSQILIDLRSGEPHAFHYTRMRWRTYFSHPQYQYQSDVIKQKMLFQLLHIYGGKGLPYLGLLAVTRLKCWTAMASNHCITAISISWKHHVLHRHPCWLVCSNFDFGFFINRDYAREFYIDGGEAMANFGLACLDTLARGRVWQGAHNSLRYLRLGCMAQLIFLYQRDQRVRLCERSLANLLWRQPIRIINTP